MDSIIEYYEGGGPTGGPEYKARAKQYIKMLKKEYYEEENPRGVQSLYFVLKAKHPDDGEHPRDHPPKRFVADWLRRQGKHQVYRQKKGKAKSIQSVITSEPNELIQVDYVYFFPHHWPGDGTGAVRPRCSGVGRRRVLPLCDRGPQVARN